MTVHFVVNTLTLVQNVFHFEKHVVWILDADGTSGIPNRAVLAVTDTPMPAKFHLKIITAPP